MAPWPCPRHDAVASVCFYRFRWIAIGIHLTRWPWWPCPSWGLRWIGEAWAGDGSGWRSACWGLGRVRWLEGRDGGSVCVSISFFSLRFSFSHCSHSSSLSLSFTLSSRLLICQLCLSILWRGSSALSKCCSYSSAEIPRTGAAWGREGVCGVL